MTVRGQYQVKCIDNVIFVTLEGMFNESTSAKISRQVEALIQGLDGNGFYMLFNLLHYQGSTPAAHQVGNTHAIWLETQNCLGKAVVTNERVMLDIVRNQQTQLLQSKINSQVFYSESDAEAWLLSLKAG